MENSGEYGRSEGFRRICVTVNGKEKYQIRYVDVVRNEMKSNATYMVL